MSYTPSTLSALASLWTSKGGKFLGVVGSITTHCGGYHLGKDRIYGPCACKPTGTCQAGLGDHDYSMTDNVAADKDHATNAAMAIDLGPLAGHTGSEVDLAKWLIAQCQKSAPDTLDIRGINYQTLRWDRQRSVTSPVYVHNVNESGHAHIEFYRDSELRDKTAAVKRWLAQYLPVTKVVKCDGGYLHTLPQASSATVLPLPSGTTMLVTKTVTSGAWSFVCNGVSLAGTSWYYGTVAGKSGYAAAGRF